MDDQAPEEKPKHAQPKELAEIKKWLREYGTSTGITVALALALFLGVTLYRMNRSSSERRASELLVQAQSPDDFQQVVDQYAGTTAAPVALLSMASSRFHEGRFDVALTLYQQFLDEHPEHPLATAAVLGQAYCQEGLMQWDTALDAFRAFAGKHPQHALEPLAQFGEARVLVQLGKPQEALAIYQAYLDEHPEGNAPWRSQARTALLYLEKDMRAQQAAVP